MTNIWIPRALLGLLLISPGCASSDDGGAPAGAAGQNGTAETSTGGSAGAAGASGGVAGNGGSGGKAPDPGITLSGTVLARPASGPDTPLEGASVCIVARADIPCALTDATGEYELSGAPRGVETGIVVSKSGYLSVARLGRNGSSPTMKLGPTALASLEAAQAFATAAGFSYPTAGTALVYVSAVTPGANGYEALANATISLTVPFAKGPVYAQEGDVPDPKATASTKDGGAYFSGISPGAFEAIVTVPGKLCAAAVGGWASPMSGHLAGVALADTLTTIAISCE